MSENIDCRGYRKAIDRNRIKVWHRKGGAPYKARLAYTGKHLSWDLVGKVELKRIRTQLLKINSRYLESFKQ
jgi:hypothetical protein